MGLRKLRLELDQILEPQGYSELNPFQDKIITALKSGQHILASGENGIGKTTTILFCLLQKITEPGEGSPRGIVMCSNDDNAYEMFVKLKPLCAKLDLTVDLVHERGNMLQQRNDLFDGTEIIIGTPKRLYDLYIQNGFNVSKLKIFILDDADELFKKGHKMQIARISESLPKCQHVIFTTASEDLKVKEYYKDNMLYYTHIQ
jgi:superfamily II DNA/RNA helicase